MRLATRIRMAFLSLFRRGRASVNLDDEIRDHLERQIAEHIAAGMSPDEARFAAFRQFGNPALIREQARSTWRSCAGTQDRIGGRSNSGWLFTTRLRLCSRAVRA